MPGADNALLALVVMASATYLTRISGYWAVAHLPPSRHLARQLELLSQSTLAALAAVVLVSRDLPAIVGVGAGAAMLIASGRYLPAFAVAMAATAIARM